MVAIDSARQPFRAAPTLRSEEGEVMNAFLLALVIWALPFLGVSCGSTPVQNPSIAQSQPTPTPTPTQEAMTLTDREPIASFPLTPDQVNNPPEILEIVVTKVANPGSSPVSIFASVEPADGKRKAEGVELGNFSLYPVDRPGKFMLGPEAAFRQANKTINLSKDEKWQLRLVMQLPEQNKSSVEVTIASPNWQGKK